MFNFFKISNKASLNFSGIGVDIHSHLIPSIDDGAKTIEDSLALVQGLQGLGFKKIITTPHVYQELYPNTKDGILTQFSVLKAALKAANISIPIEASAEYFMDTHFDALLNKKEILPLSGKYVLVEMSFFGAPPELETYIFKLQLKGYIPILAHPERYLFYNNNDYKQFHLFKEQGILLQLNTLSAMGYYGKPTKLLAEKLLKDKLIDVMGTDMHHIGHLDYINANFKQKEFQQLLSKYEFKNAELFSL